MYLENDTGFLLSSVLERTLMNSLMLNYSCIPGMKITCLGFIILLIQCWILFPDILFRKFAFGL